MYFENIYMYARMYVNKRIQYRTLTALLTRPFTVKIRSELNAPSVATYRDKLYHTASICNDNVSWTQTTCLMRLPLERTWTWPLSRGAWQFAMRQSFFSFFPSLLLIYILFRVQSDCCYHIIIVVIILLTYPYFFFFFFSFLFLFITTSLSLFLYANNVLDNNQ